MKSESVLNGCIMTSCNCEEGKLTTFSPVYGLEQLSHLQLKIWAQGAQAM